MWSLIFFIILGLPVSAGQDLATLSQSDNLVRIVSETSHNISGPVLSEDGKWLVLRQRSWLPAWEKSDLNMDSIFFFNQKSSGKFKIEGYRQNVWRISFAGDDHLLFLFSNERNAELHDLNQQTSIFFNDVISIQALERNNQFVLHYHEDSGNRLELRNSSGELVNATANVIRYFALRNNHIYAITKNKGEGHQIQFLNGPATEKIYDSTQKIVSLEVEPDEHGLMILEQPPGGAAQEMVFLDLANKEFYPLKEVLPLVFRNGFAEVINEGGFYFVRLWIECEQKDNTLADIWYGNDNQLERKFQSSEHDVCYIWKPREKKVRKIGTHQFSKIGNIGNNRYFLSFDPYLLQDYTQPAPIKMSIYDQLNDRYSLLDTIVPRLFTSRDGEYIIYSKNAALIVYHLPTGRKMDLVKDQLKTPWFLDNIKAVIFEGEGGLWRYDLLKNELTQLNCFDGYDVTIVNGTSRIALHGFNFFEKTVHADKPLLLKLYNQEENKSAYLLWKNSRCDTIIPPTDRLIKNLVYNDAYTHFCYIEEDYNLPPQLVYKEIGRSKQVLYRSNPNDTDILSLKQEIISYTNRDGVPLNGILFYPLNYKPSDKYPMVVHIYQKQRHLSNHFRYPSYYESCGFNIRLLIESGYFVYLPDILIQGKYGPGLEALDCVNHALDAIAGNALIDTKKIGLIGHSFGGYETNFIATHSDRFATYVSGSGHSDIIKALYSFNYNFRFPEFVRIETLHYKMRVPFSENKTLYTQNNPVYHAEKVNTPVLLWTGLTDENVTPDHTMAFYLALRRNQKEVIALFYKDEGHAIQNPDTQVDLTSKILDWFNFYLNNETDIEWINNGIE